MPNTLRLHAIGQIKDLVVRIGPYDEPFLYYLPQLLTQPKFMTINADYALIFVEKAVNQDRPPLINDALAILNKIVNGGDGSFNRPDSLMFYNNHSFLWKELGSHTNAIDTITHILNKTFFILSLGK